MLRVADRRVRDLSRVQHLGHVAVCDESQAQQAEVLDDLRVLQDLDRTEGIADSEFWAFLAQAPGIDVSADTESPEASVGQHKKSSERSSAETTDQSEEAKGIRLAVRYGHTRVCQASPQPPTSGFKQW